MACPKCGRPLAVARASCLYCGAALGEAAAAANASQPLPAPEPALENEPRSLVVLDLDGVDPPELADAFRLPAAETAQWVRRGGFRLTTAAASPGEAASEVERLTSLGLHAVAIEGSRLATARAPHETLGARCSNERLYVSHHAGSLEIGPNDVLLLVQGPIHREYQTSLERRRFRLATLDHGYLFHLHLVHELRPVELDPHAIEFDGDDGQGSSLLRVKAWIERLGRSWPVDDGFRRLPPALGLEKPSGGRLKLAAALHGGGESAAQVLDNVGQFRFFSAWRGLVARELRSS